MEPDKRGKTLWEILMERLHRGSGNGQGIAFENPLDLRVGSAVAVPYSNGPELAGYDFAVQEIREYNRRIGEQTFPFTDYVLRGANTKTFLDQDALTARLRTMPKAGAGHDSLLLRLYDEFGFAEEFLDVLKDTSGVFEAKDDQTGANDSFSRPNDLRDSYEASVLVIAATNPDGKAVPGKASALKLEYWDYWRDIDIGQGNKAKEFLFVEMNSDTGWFQLWRGREFFSD